jgi:hypothetical protein
MNVLYTEDVGSAFLRNVNKHLPDYTASYPRREYSTGRINSVNINNRMFLVLKMQCVFCEVETEFLNIASTFRCHAVAKLIEELCYKPEGRGFDFRLGHWIFQLT